MKTTTYRLPDNKDRYICIEDDGEPADYDVQDATVSIRTETARKAEGICMGRSCRSRNW